MTMIAGKQEHQPFPVRSPGFIQPYAGTLPAAGYLLEYDGYWVSLTQDIIRTIGNTGSGAAIAQSWIYLLYELIWNSYSDTQCPIFTSGGLLTSRGFAAGPDWGQGKRLSLPDIRGRAIVGVGTGANPSILTARTLGSAFGTENHTLSISEMPSHTHTLRISGAPVYSAALSGSGTNNVNNDSGANVGGSQWLNEPTGGGGAHNNIQPSIGQHFLISTGAR